MARDSKKFKIISRISALRLEVDFNAAEMNSLQLNRELDVVVGFQEIKF